MNSYQDALEGEVRRHWHAVQEMRRARERTPAVSRLYDDLANCYRETLRVLLNVRREAQTPNRSWCGAPIPEEERRRER